MLFERRLIFRRIGSRFAVNGIPFPLDGRSFFRAAEQAQSQHDPDKCPADSDHELPPGEWWNTTIPHETKAIRGPNRPLQQNSAEIPADATFCEGHRLQCRSRIRHNYRTCCMSGPLTPTVLSFTTFDAAQSELSLIVRQVASHRTFLARVQLRQPARRSNRPFFVLPTIPAQAE